MFLPAFEYYPRDLNNAATLRILVNPLYFYLFCVNINLILNSFYTRELFDKRVSLFNLYAISVGLNNAATSRILVNPAVILIL